MDALSEMFALRNLPSPYQPHITDNLPATICSNLERWENMPSRREPITLAMTRDLERKSLAAPRDTFDNAFWDWFVLSRYTGFRVSEFAQRGQDKADYHETPDNRRILKALNRTDITFRDTRGKNIKDLRAVTDMGTVHSIFVRWRIQKNRRNGERINLQRDDTHPSLCPVRAAIRIVLRSYRLQTQPEGPLAVFINNTGKRKYITGAKIAETFRASASAVHGITDKKELSMYSAHSMRVTAAVLLHEAGKSGDYIKIRLRWTSDTFMMYLRNTDEQARNHVLAVTEANTRLHMTQLSLANCPDDVFYTVAIDEDGPRLQTHRDVCL